MGTTREGVLRRAASQAAAAEKEKLLSFRERKSGLHVLASKPTLLVGSFVKKGTCSVTLSVGRKEKGTKSIKPIFSRAVTVKPGGLVELDGYLSDLTATLASNRI